MLLWIWLRDWYPSLKAGFSQALNIAKEIANEIGIEHVFTKKRQVRRKRHFDEANVEETSLTPEESFVVTLENRLEQIVDQVIGSLENRLEKYQFYENSFGFLFNSHKLNSLDGQIGKMP